MKNTINPATPVLSIILSALLMAAGAFTSCAGDGPGSQALWEEIIPATLYPDFEYNTLTPSCSAYPGTNASFSFFAKQTDSPNLLIFFQGGGACWHENNCISDGLSGVTYNTRRLEFTGLFEAGYFGGILDRDTSLNPFKDWNIVYIPYCTGDLHGGAQDTVYGSNTIRHRGFVNFQAVLTWIKEKFSAPEKIFVSGSSAGAYGALLNFPYIIDEYPGAAAWLLGDAGNGVVPPGFLSTAETQWNIQFHSVYGVSPEDLSIADMYSALATEYSDSLFAQYTSAWDDTQAYFYNVMLNIDNPASWDSYDSEQCTWNTSAAALMNEVADNNYRFYRGDGDGHTILLSDSFYSDSSGGILFADWVAAMAAASVPVDPGSDFQDSNCTGECDIPDGLVCSK